MRGSLPECSQGERTGCGPPPATCHLHPLLLVTSYPQLSEGWWEYQWTWTPELERRLEAENISSRNRPRSTRHEPCAKHTTTVWEYKNGKAQYTVPSPSAENFRGLPKVRHLVKHRVRIQTQTSAEKWRARGGVNGFFCYPMLHPHPGNWPLNHQMVTEHPLLPRHCASYLSQRSEQKSTFINTILFQLKRIVLNTHPIRNFLASLRDKLSLLICLCWGVEMTTTVAEVTATMCHTLCWALDDWGRLN